MTAEHSAEEFQLFPAHTAREGLLHWTTFYTCFHQHPAQSESNGGNLDPLMCERKKNVHKPKREYYLTILKKEKKRKEIQPRKLHYSSFPIQRQIQI